jgi:hypothetical protein
MNVMPTAAALTALTLAAACGATPAPANSHANAPSATDSATSDPVTSAAPPSPTGSPTTAGPTGRPDASCATRDLKAGVADSQGTAGSTYITVTFTKISGSPCTLYGYPGVSLAAGTPITQIGAAAAHESTPSPSLVSLVPGDTAHFLLKITDAHNYPPAACNPANATYLQIYPPNQTTPTYFAYRTVACSKPIRVLTVSVLQGAA